MSRDQSLTSAPHAQRLGSHAQPLMSLPILTLGGSVRRRVSLLALGLISALGLQLSAEALSQSSQAYAEKPLVMLVPLVTTDRVSKPMSAAFDEHMRQQLKENPDLNAKVALLDLESTQAKVKEVGCGRSCAETRAIVNLAKTAQVRFVFVAEVDNEDEIFSIKMRLFDGALKKLYKSDEDSCEFCNEDEVKDKLTRALTNSGFLKALATPGPEPKKDDSPPPVFPIKITSSPTGALISINGGALGPAPLQVNLDPGVYKVSVALKGYLPQEREFKTPEKASEAATELGFTLKPEPPREFQATFQSEPPGAQVYLDGELLAEQSPVTIKIKPGPHSVRYELKGYELGTKSFSTPDHPEDLMIELALKKQAPTPPPEPVAKPTPKPTPKPTALPKPSVSASPAPPSLTTSFEIPPPPSLLSKGSAGLLIGAGALSAGVGMWLVFKHGEVACSDGRGRLECPEIYNTRGLGAPLVGLGAISLGAGIMGALIRSEWPQAPVISPQAGGGSLSWSLDF